MTENTLTIRFSKMGICEGDGPRRKQNVIWFNDEMQMDTPIEMDQRVALDAELMEGAMPKLIVRFQRREWSAATSRTVIINDLIIIIAADREP